MKAKRKPRPARCPTMVTLHLDPNRTLRYRLAVESLRSGLMSRSQFNELLNCRDMLLLGGDAKNDECALAVAAAAGDALGDMRDRFTSTGNFDPTEEDIAAVEAMAHFSDDFWNRTSGCLFGRAEDALERMRIEQAIRAEAA